MKTKLSKRPSSSRRKTARLAIYIVIAAAVVFTGFNIVKHDSFIIFQSRIKPPFRDALIVYKTDYASSWDRSIHVVVAGELKGDVDVKSLHNTTPYTKLASIGDPQWIDFEKEQRFLESTLDHFGNIASRNLSKIYSELRSEDSKCIRNAAGSIRELLCLSSTRKFIYLAQGTSHDL